MKAPLNDVVVVLPGIMGSELSDANGDIVWSTKMGSLVKGVLTRGKAIKRLTLPEGIGDEPAPDGVTATRLLADIHVIPGIWSVSIGYDRLLHRLRERFEVIEADVHGPLRPANLVPFAYDWRLSNRASAIALQAAVEPVLERFRAAGHPQAKLVFICHSMGGLVCRYYTDVLGGADLTRKVITLGTPHRGAVNALASLVNGVRKGWGPLSIDLTDFARSMPALYQLLPEYACVDTPDGLMKTTEVRVPELNQSMVEDAMAFHEQLRTGAAGVDFDVHSVLARTQPTDTTARLVDGRVETLRTIDGRDEAGDGTVPRLSASAYGIDPTDPSLRYVMDKHGALPANDPVWDELEGVLTARSQIARDPDLPIGVACDDVLFAGEPLHVEITAESELAVTADVLDPCGAVVGSAVVADRGDDSYSAHVDGLAPGCYVLRVGIRGQHQTVSTPLIVADPTPE